MRCFLLGLATIALLFGGGPLRADSLVFDVGNPGISGNNAVTAPYATVTVTGDTNTGIVTFSATVTQANINSAAAKLGEFGFNYDHSKVTSGFSLAGFTGTGGDASSWSLGNGGQMNGFGSFDKIVGPSSNAAGNHLTTYQIQLQLNDFSQALASNFEVLSSGAAGDGNMVFASHLYPNSGNTGFIGVSSAGAAAAPAPSSLLLLGIGVVGLLGYRWRQGKLVAVAAV